MPHILIVDDDVSIGDLLEEVLREEGYAVSRAYSGTEALMLLERTRPDLVLLDLMLPGLSGEEVLARTQDTPVLILSAKADPDHKAELLWHGAADYVTKPFSLRELLARIALRLREASLSSCAAISSGPLRLDPHTHAAYVEQTPVHLTRTEYAILKLLLSRPTQVIPKSRLLDQIAQDTPDCTESSLKTHMSNLRKKLRDAGAGECIEAVWGIGFKMALPS